MKGIEELVAYQEDIDVAKIKSDNSKADVIKARHLVWYLMFKTSGLSFEEIGDLYGRGHIAIRDGINRIKTRCTKSKEYREYVERLKSKL